MMRSSPPVPPPMPSPLVSAVLAAALVGPLALRQPRTVGGVAAFPEIAAPATPEQRRINSDLARLDRRARTAARECLAGARGRGEWSRQVDVTMRGPEFLSFEVTDDTDCGGAHPSQGHFAIVYDLASGAPVDWTRLLPRSLTGKLDLLAGADGVRTVTLASPRLSQLYAKGYDRGSQDDPQDAKDCREAITQALAGGPVPMSAWLDAAEGGLALQFDLGHAEEACADPVTAPAAVLKREGASPRLVAALEAAHAAAEPPGRVSPRRR